jgi:hypothetical protein
MDLWVCALGQVVCDAGASKLDALGQLQSIGSVGELPGGELARGKQTTERTKPGPIQDKVNVLCDSHWRGSATAEVPCVLSQL